jgi:hypothetical protein
MNPPGAQGRGVALKTNRQEQLSGKKKTLGSANKNQRGKITGEQTRADKLISRNVCPATKKQRRRLTAKSQMRASRNRGEQLHGVAGSWCLEPKSLSGENYRQPIDAQEPNWDG